MANIFSQAAYEDTFDFLKEVKVKPYQGLKGFVPSDLSGEYKPVAYYVKQIINPGDLVVVFGESGTFKSFLVLDLSCHLAAGIDYCGHRVRQTGVLYIAGEGGEGLKKRVKAWMIKHQKASPKLFVATEQANLKDDPNAIKATIAEAERVLGVDIGVVVFDTLAANFGAGDESKAEDMGIVIRHARQACGHRAILLVHHVGHGAKDRERGSSSLRGNADCRILVDRPGKGNLIAVTCIKAKDGEEFSQLAFESRVVDLGWNDIDGEALTSLVLDSTAQRVKNEPSSKTHKAVIAVLKDAAQSLRRAEVVRRLDPMGISKTSVYRAIGDLLDAGLLVEGFDKVSIPENVE